MQRTLLSILQVIPLDLVGIQVQFEAAVIGIHNSILRHVGVVDNTVLAVCNKCVDFHIVVGGEPLVQAVLAVGRPQDGAVQHTAVLEGVGQAGDVDAAAIAEGVDSHLDFGIYPYTTSSNSIASYAPVGSGLPSAKIGEVIGVVKAYSTCVGEGPFVCEMFGAEAEALREAGLEYGAKTGRPRRVGPIDIVATRYGVQIQGATNIALTKPRAVPVVEAAAAIAIYDALLEQERRR